MGRGTSTTPGQQPQGHTAALRPGTTPSFHQGADRHLYRRPVP
jgi:hypothetical protein